MAKVESVLFVCWGNICRSPAAEVLLKRKMKQIGVKGVQIKSAGVSPDDGSHNPSWAMRWASVWRGVWLRPRPRLLTKKDVSRFDLVIAMDREVLFSIKAIAGGQAQKVKLLSEFLPTDSPVDVPDPMHRSFLVCNRVLDMLETACTTICRKMNRMTANSVSARCCQAVAALPKVELNLKANRLS